MLNKFVFNLDLKVVREFVTK